jgi:glycosidase
MKHTFIFILFLALLMDMGCKNTSQTTNKADTKSHTDWSKNAVIYEVNIRQFTQEGTFKAFERHLPRLKDMGVDILWLMPIHPIGIKNRKGSLGSHYAVKDYLNVNPDYGTMADFKHLVKTAHDHNMKVIIDWVANHSAYDNRLVDEHKDWYVLDEKGNPKPPVADWSDVADLNYDKPELRAYMTDALKFWIQQTNIDGYRCDVADMVPNDFWEKSIAELRKIKPIFMLAEADKPEMHTIGFDMTYAWEFHHLLNKVAKGEKTADDIKAYYQSENYKRYSKANYRMNFTSNHDENSWNGSEYERMGSANAVKCLGVLAATTTGMLLIYTGQEDSLTRRLKFFDKDAIQWGHYSLENYYKALCKVKKDNPSLWNGEFGGDMQFIDTKNPNILAFTRQKGEKSVLVILNLSNEAQTFFLDKSLASPKLEEIFTHEKADAEKEIFLKAWGYRVFAR